MHAIASADSNDGGTPTPPRGAAAAVPIRVCVYGSDASIEAVCAAAPANAHMSFFGDRATAAPAGIDVHAFAGADPTRVLAAAARRYPGDPLLLVRGDVHLPAHAFERLLRALDEPDVLAAFPLDDGARSPLSAALAADAPAIDADRIDAMCFAHADRCLLADPHYPSSPPAVSAWHGERIARIGVEALADRDIIDSNGLRVVLLDHLYVAAGSARDGAAAPTPALDGLRARLADALATAAHPGAAALDARPVVLHVLHGWGGGAERWVRDIAATDRTANHLVLIARGSFARRRHGEWLELHDGALVGPPLRRWPLPRSIADTALGDATYRALFERVLREFCVDAIAISSLIGHSLDALRSDRPLYWIVHDHYPLWPQLHRDFGDPALAFDDAQRARDLAAAGADGEFAERDPRHWARLRDATVAALRAARAVLVAPSRSALANQLRLAPELRELPAHVIAHGFDGWPQPALATSPPPPRRRLRLLVPGRVRRGKGAELLIAALPALRAHAELFLLGAGSDAHALFGETDVHILLDYRRDDLPALVARVQPDAALLLPTVAETFSYTLSEMRSLGVPVIATRIGALAERIDDGTDGFLVAAEAEAIVARVAALAADRPALENVRAALAAQSPPSTADMARAYAQLFALGPRPLARYGLQTADGEFLRGAALEAALERARLRERALVADIEHARAESERRGDWGHSLDRELGGARRALATLQDEFDTRTQWALQLSGELDHIKPLHERMLASRSWRITAPLRSATDRVRAVRASLAFRTVHLRNLVGRVRGSIAQRGLAGTLARVAQELRGAGPARARFQYAEPSDDFSPFALPTSDAPRVSIVMPVYNKIAYTIACLRSLAAHAGATPFEVIVVDDASSDATAQRLADMAGVRTLRNATNLGFIGSCNAGAATARGDYVLFLNNDTIVTAGWLEALVRCIEDAPRAGLVGARLVYPDGRLQEAGGIVFNDGSGWNYGRFEEPDDPRYGFRREADYVSGAAILLRRDLFQRLGAFDTRYAPAYYEDTDLAFAVRAAGYKVYYEPASTVVHFEGVTSGTDTASGAKRYQVINREKFLAKWVQALAAQPAPGTPIGRAATHRAGKRVLIVDATTPTPDQDSGSLRMVNLMRVLADLGCQTTFLPDNRAWTERYTRALQALGVEALYAPYAANPVALLRERGREFDLIVLSRHYVAASYVGLARLYAPQATLAFDTVDLHYLREQRAAELSGKAELARHAAATRAQELKLIRECDVTLVVSPAEQELLARDAPGRRVDVLSNVHDVFGCRQPFDARRDLVFVGGFQHPPNVDAVTWFVHEVLPEIGGALAGVRLHVIGSKVPDAIRALANERVIVHGYVEDIAPYMDGCRVSVAPLRYGAGVKGKVNMAMSYGLPVVATPIAVEGMYVRAGEDVAVADDAAEFARTIERVYLDEALWNRLSTNGLANVARHFSFDAARAAVEKLLQR